MIGAFGEDNAVETDVGTNYKERKKQKRKREQLVRDTERAEQKVLNNVFVSFLATLLWFCCPTVKVRFS